MNMGYAKEKEIYTPEQYLELEQNATFKSEYIHGEIIAMAGASRKHNIISLNLATFLHGHLRSKPCRVYMADLRVQATGLFTYPDVLITCGEEKLLDKYKDTLLNPMCIIEVLSESTEKYDRGEKFLYYQRIDSLKEYILVSQEMILVESYQKQDNNKWLYQKYDSPSEDLDINSVQVKIKLEEIYTGVEELMHTK